MANSEGAARSVLSLRAIARELGMVSSAVYRYMASRDELLTKLIIDAYDSLGAAAEAMEALQDRRDLVGRWSAVCTAVRNWAIANPNEYALIYGSPVPGYVAPLDTIGPASRVANLLVQILVEAVTGRGLEASGMGGPGAGGMDRPGAGSAGDAGGPVTEAAHRALAPIRAHLPAVVPDPAMQAGLMVWSALFGTVSFELFGQFHNVIGESPGDREAFFAECVRRWACQLGLA
jgi:AcrR family transcriptional regulator